MDYYTDKFYLFNLQFRLKSVYQFRLRSGFQRGTPLSYAVAINQLFLITRPFQYHIHQSVFRAHIYALVSLALVLL